MVISIRSISLLLAVLILDPKCLEVVGGMDSVKNDNFSGNCFCGLGLPCGQDNVMFTNTIQQMYAHLININFQPDFYISAVSGPEVYSIVSYCMCGCLNLGYLCTCSCIIHH